MKNVLILGGGGYNAQSVYQALKDTLRYNPILASGNDNHSSFISKDAITDLPYDYESNFILKLNEYIKKYEIDFIIPTHDTSAMILMKNENIINATIVCSPYETTRICRSKKLTYEILKEFDFCPNIYSINELDIKFPIFAKDDEGQGARNAKLINSFEELKMLDKNINYILCEYLPGEEITIDCLTDKNNHLVFSQPRTRERILNGISARSHNILLTDELAKIVSSISEKINFRGYWYIQCKKDEYGKYKLMEISTRFAGTFNLSKNLDVNLPLLVLEDFSNRNIDVMPNNYTITLDKGYIDRYKINYEYERVYIDFDDTLVFDRKKYNTEAMRFIYQCLNNSIELVLITKHAYNLDETMSLIKLNKSIFSKIIECPTNDMKWIYMDNKKKSIFIDNAFIERKYVKENLKMPTFDVTNIECLIDWRD